MEKCLAPDKTRRACSFNIKYDREHKCNNIESCVYKGNLGFKNDDV